MTRHFRPESDEARSNTFVDKIAARFIAASDALTPAAAALDGRDHVSAKELDDLRWTAGSVARSCDAVLAILTHFEGALSTPGGNDLGAVEDRSAGLQQLHIRGLVTAALAGGVA